MGSQIEQLKNRAKEYAKAYHEKEVKRSVHKRRNGRNSAPGRLADGTKILLL